MGAHAVSVRGECVCWCISYYYFVHSIIWFTFYSYNTRISRYIYIHGLIWWCSCWERCGLFPFNWMSFSCSRWFNFDLLNMHVKIGMYNLQWTKTSNHNQRKKGEKERHHTHTPIKESSTHRTSVQVHCRWEEKKKQIANSSHATNGGREQKSNFQYCIFLLWSCNLFSLANVMTAKWRCSTEISK